MPSTGEGSDRKPVDLSQISKQFLSEQQAAGRSPITVAVYRRILTDLRLFVIEQIGSEDIRLIDRKLLLHYQDRMASYRFGDDEKRAWFCRIKIFFAWAAASGLLFFDPAASIKVAAAKERSYPVYLTQAEVADLLSAIPVATDEGLRDRTILELLYSSGLRSSEICKLTLSDISFADGTVRVLMSKNKKDRLVPIGKIALSWLDRYIKHIHGLQRSGPLFYRLTDHSPLRYYDPKLILRKYTKDGSLAKRCSPRSFRHSFAIHLLEGGASVRHIQAMMGHASLKTTQKYLRIVPAELKRAHARAHPSNHRKWKFPDSDPVRLRKK